MTDDLTPISRYLDGDTDAACIGEIDRWLDGSPENAVRFARMAMLDSELRDLVRVRRTTSSASHAPVATKARPPRPIVAGWPHRPARAGRIGVALGVIAAALLMTAAAVIVYVFVTADPVYTPDPLAHGAVATLIDATDPVFVNDESANPGSDYESGTYALESGSAEFLLNSRVSMTLKGSSRVRLHGPMHAAVDHGSASFDVPHEAVGFTLDLPGGVRVVDLGTRFRVWVDALGGRRVSVIEGRVRIESTLPGQDARIDTVTEGTTWLAGADDGVATSPLVVPIRPVRIDASETELATDEDFSADNLAEPDRFEWFWSAEELADVTASAARTWVTSTQARGTAPTITIDLGSDHELSHLLLWNYNHAPEAAWVNGVDRFVVTTATEDEGVDGLRLAEPLSQPILRARLATSGEAELAQRFDLPPVRARYVRLHLLSNHGGDRLGLSELWVLGIPVEADPAPSLKGSNNGDADPN